MQGKSITKQMKEKKIKILDYRQLTFLSKKFISIQFETIATIGSYTNGRFAKENNQLRQIDDKYDLLEFLQFYIS